MHLGKWARPAILLGASVLGASPFTGRAALSATLQFTNFGPNLSYQAHISPWCVTGSGDAFCGAASERWVAVAFRPATTIHLASFDAAIQFYGGATDGVVIDLVATVKGNPGPIVIEEWTSNAVPSAQAGQPPLHFASVRHPRLVGGRTYWLVAKPPSPSDDTVDGWAIGAIAGGSCRVAAITATGQQIWVQAAMGRVPAYDIYGR